MVRHILQPVGRIRRISAALLVDDAVDSQQANGKTSETRRKRTPEELKQIEVLAAAVIGLDEKRGDTLAVQNLSFQQLPQQTPASPSKVDRIRVIVNDWSSLIRYAVIFVLFMLTYVLLLRPIKKQALSAFSQLPDRSAAQLKAEMAASDGVWLRRRGGIVGCRTTIAGIAETTCRESKERTRGNRTPGPGLAA